MTSTKRTSFSSGYHWGALSLLVWAGACGGTAIIGADENQGQGGSGGNEGPPDASCSDRDLGPPDECREPVVAYDCRPCSEAATRSIEQCPDLDLQCVRAAAVDDTDMETCAVCHQLNTVACINRQANCDHLWAEFSCCIDERCAGANIYEAPSPLNLDCFEVECGAQAAAWNECFDEELREACADVAAAQCTR